VVARLLAEGQKVLATGGGAFMNAATRERIAKDAVSVWLKPEFETVMRRVRKRSNRPLLRNADPEAAMRRLIEERYPVYALADHEVASCEGPHENTVQRLLAALAPGSTVAPPPVVAPPRETVRVELAGRGYDILIGPGLLDEAGERIARLAPGARALVVADENVAALHLGRVEASLKRAGALAEAPSLVLPAGEGTKCFAAFERTCEAALEARLERGDLLVALGGGVIGDLVGFVAASVRRGMAFVQIPTSLLAQVDSSVGGKTGINSGRGKNLVGAFHQPALVLADADALDTLPEREFRAGYAEVAKYGLIDDAEFFARLERDRAEIFAGGPARASAIAHCCRAKATVVARDEREAGERALLNLGHTFGHAFERLAQYDPARLVHGEGVAIGIVHAFRFSVAQGLCEAADARRVEAHLRAAGLPTTVAEIRGFNADPVAILDAMGQDKKVTRGRMNLVLARGIGRSFLAADVDRGAILRFLEAEAGRVPDA
ncbi:MAG: 3-dehydroquinate synthase, partial [Hyphomicrobiales bacterium]|nr:3-dehydroquinate synthase [Hyphomicrobiales bacterium]